ncbi:MAG: tRNA (uridine(34)/cytosine(34)/5-carboxymethylaminomethyluridine(34)-2'-O)-methyltransferase TrmL [Porticoccaceae bacterium]
MFNILLYEPEIPPNTGNIIRLAANTGCHLHLIEPLGFSLDDKRMRRAGLDYSEYANLIVWKTWDDFFRQHSTARLFGLTTKATTYYSSISFRPGDFFLFGPETRGLPDHVREQLPREQLLRIPMLPNSRSMNLSNSVSVVVYEAWRQQSFEGAI